MSETHVHTHGREHHPAHPAHPAHSAHERDDRSTAWLGRATSIDPSTSPVLDIGGEVGAVVALLATRPASGELEACPADDPAARFHTGVHQRRLGEGTVWSAVFPEVRAGSHWLLDPADPDGSPLAQVTVTGGSVQHVDLR